jgi:hypothetical protein
MLFSVNWNQKRIILTEQAAVLSTPNTINCTVRKYLTAREVEQLMDRARKHSRHGHRDATMILVAYRHGLRASEVCGLEWHQIELDQGRMHVRRAKNGTPSVHPIRGDEIRALRRLRRDNPGTPAVQACQRWPRHSRPAALPRAQEYPAHSALYRAKSRPIQRLLALTREGVRLTELDGSAQRSIGLTWGFASMPDRAKAKSAILRCRKRVVPLHTVNESLNGDAMREAQRA